MGRFFKHKGKSLIVLWLMMALPSLAHAKDGLLIIANQSVPLEHLSKDDINKIFLLKQTVWENGQAIVPVNREATSAARIEFSETVLGRSPRSLSNYWNQMHFKGYMPPVVQESDEAMIAFIRRVPGAIGYVKSGNMPKNVKVLESFK